MRRGLDCSGWVLAGGAGRRIGTPKALLRLQGRSLVARSVRCLRRAGIPTAVLGPRSLRPTLEADGLHGLRIFPDEVPGQGPLPALLNALRQSRTEWNFVVACDYPLLHPRLLHALIAAARLSSADAVIPMSPEGRLQPLCGLYRKPLHRRLERILAAGDSRIFDLLDAIHIEVLPWRDLARSGCRRDILLNLNRPSQLRGLHRFR